MDAKRLWCMVCLFISQLILIPSYTVWRQRRLCDWLEQGYHLSGISGNLKMSGNSAKVSKKLGKKPQIQGKVREFV